MVWKMAESDARDKIISIDAEWGKKVLSHLDSLNSYRVLSRGYDEKGDVFDYAVWGPLPEHIMGAPGLGEYFGYSFGVREVDSDRLGLLIGFPHPSGLMINGSIEFRNKGGTPNIVRPGLSEIRGLKGLEANQYLLEKAIETYKAIF